MFDAAAWALIAANPGFVLQLGRITRAIMAAERSDGRAKLQGLSSQEFMTESSTQKKSRG